ERHLVGDRGGLDPGEGAQRGQVAAGARVLLGVVADAGDLDAHQLVLDQAAGLADLGDAVADHEQRVADDGAGQRDLDDDQRGGGPVPQQGGKDGADVHVGLRWGAGRPARYWLLSWMAGVTCMARQAGSSPASTLATTARTKVSSSMPRSRWASSA